MSSMVIIVCPFQGWWLICLKGANYGGLNTYGKAEAHEHSRSWASAVRLRREERT